MGHLGGILGSQYEGRGYSHKRKEVAKGRGLMGNSDKFHLMDSVSHGKKRRQEGRKKGAEKPEADV